MSSGAGDFWVLWKIYLEMGTMSKEVGGRWSHSLDFELFHWVRLAAPRQSGHLPTFRCSAGVNEKSDRFLTARNNQMRGIITTSERRNLLLTRSCTLAAKSNTMYSLQILFRGNLRVETSYLLPPEPVPCNEQNLDSPFPLFFHQLES